MLIITVRGKEKYLPAFGSAVNGFLAVQKPDVLTNPGSGQTIF